MSQNLEAALTVLDAVAAHPDCGLSELTRHTGLNKSRVYRILTVLADQGYVRQDADAAYRLGLQALALGQMARQHFDRLREIEFVVQEYLGDIDENVQCRVRTEGEVVQIFAKKSQQRLRVESQVGNRRPLGRGASGLLLLAHAPEGIREPRAAELGIGEARLAEIRDQGHAESQGELTAGIWALAVPLLDTAGRCDTALSVSVPESRADDSYRAVLQERLRDAAAAITLPEQS